MATWNPYSPNSSPQISDSSHTQNTQSPSTQTEFRPRSLQQIMLQDWQEAYPPISMLAKTKTNSRSFLQSPTPNIQNTPSMTPSFPSYSIMMPIIRPKQLPAPKQTMATTSPKPPKPQTRTAHLAPPQWSMRPFTTKPSRIWQRNLWTWCKPPCKPPCATFTMTCNKTSVNPLPRLTTTTTTFHNKLEHFLNKTNISINSFPTFFSMHPSSSYGEDGHA